MSFPVGADTNAVGVPVALLTDSRKAYVGGFPIGLALKTDGVMVIDLVPVGTIVGNVFPTTPLCKGDIIKSLEGKSVLYANDIPEIIKNLPVGQQKVSVSVQRGNETLQLESTLLKEDLSGLLKMGLAVKDSISGIGTVTFVKPNGDFGCLGHAICDAETGVIVPCKYGNAYACKIIGYNKGIRGKAGELKGVFSGAKPFGTIEKNEKYGIYGKLNEYENLGQIFEVGDRHTVSPGKAKILTTVNAVPEYFDIEIIKTMGQNTPDDKSMIIRVTDKRLVQTTGGIIQGMSGSPILQNNKIVGAVTHVFINDPTKGYGIYADWMYDN